ncbi:tape measure protein [Mycetocola saprophilus]|uniref:tape measure protein n=1 Tax=Mycetocola saprophilus TaxID=76636 RepID=UPI0004C171CF|nr:tape measure protein [Mycetocola saprophilus]
MEVGTLTARLTLDGKREFDSGVADSGRKMSETAREASSAGATIANAFKAAAGTAVMLTAGVAATGVAVFKTGAAYNSMQQNARQGLSTVMGSAKAAAEQMDRLDAFAKNSPFSKAVFINAQQQLLGFGVEAKKVIPTLDAVQNAVAGIGGSNQEISEVVSILAKIRSGASFGQEDMNQLADRGINAADLMAKAFGKSEMEFRDSIFGNPLKGKDALKAFDALVEGMGTKFAGTTDKIKEQWTGAADRIKAATRDIGSAMAEPFISKSGGGLAVRWGNDFADVLRGVERQTKSLVPVMMSGLAPAVTAVDGAFMRAKIAVNNFTVDDITRSVRELTQYTPGIAAVGGAVAAMGLQNIPILGKFLPAINPIAAALLAVAATSPPIRQAGAELMGALKPLAPVGIEVAKAFSNTLAAALPIVAGAIIAVTRVAEPLVGVVSAIPAPVLAATIAAIGLSKGLSDVVKPTAAFGQVLQRLGEQMAVQSALGAMEGNTSKLAGTFGVAGRAATGLGLSLKAAFISNPVGLAITAVAIAAGALVAGLSAAGEAAANATRKVEDYRQTLSETGNTTARTAELIKKNLDEAFSSSDAWTGAEDISEKIEGVGVSSAWAADAIKSGGPAYDALIAQLEQTSKQTERTTDIHGRASEQMTENARIALRVKEAVEAERGAVEKSTEDYKKALEQYKQNYIAMSDAERKSHDLAIAFEAAGNESNSAADRIRAMRTALDLLNGGVKSAADLTQDLNKVGRDLVTVFSETDESGKNLAKSLIITGGEFDTTSAAGAKLRDAMKAVQGESDEALRSATDLSLKNKGVGLSAKEAAEVMIPYAQKIREAGAAAGLSEQDIQSLIDTWTGDPVTRAFILTGSEKIPEMRVRVAELAKELGTVPEEVEFLVSDDGTITAMNRSIIELSKSSGEIPRHVAFAITDNGTLDATRLAAIKLADQITATPDKHIEIDSPADAITESLKVLGFTVTSLPDGRVRLTAPDIPLIDRQLDDLTKKRRDATINAVQGRDEASNWLTQLTQARTVKIGVTYDQAKGPVPIPNANGGMYSYGGGNVQAFANGGFPSGIYAGMGAGIHKFAEKETIWEAYVSGKPGQEKRNQAILSEAARRLGGVAAFANGAIANSRVTTSGAGTPPTPVGPLATQVVVHPEVSLAGAVLSATIDGRPIEVMIHDQIVQADAAASSQIRRGRARF